MLTTAIVGGGAPIANGLALANQIRGNGKVTIVNFGDGASPLERWIALISEQSADAVSLNDFSN
jgi:TPP-dependent pyruvate/acetoin dehydrogenase alpha subunit